MIEPPKAEPDWQDWAQHQGQRMGDCKRDGVRYGITDEYGSSGAEEM